MIFDTFSIKDILFIEVEVVGINEDILMIMDI
jgi:hypothetical protein